MVEKGWKYSWKKSWEFIIIEVEIERHYSAIFSLPHCFTDFYFNPMVSDVINDRQLSGSRNQSRHRWMADGGRRVNVWWFLLRYSPPPLVPQLVAVWSSNEGSCDAQVGINYIKNTRRRGGRRRGPACYHLPLRQVSCAVCVLLPPVVRALPPLSFEV